MLVAAIQMTSTENHQQNIVKATQLIEQAACRGAKIVALPENFYYLDMEGEPYPIAINNNGKLTKTLSEIAAKQRIYLIAGTIPEKIEGSHKTYNSTLVFNPTGQLIGCYRKIHLFDFSPDSQKAYSESHLIEKGTEAIVVDTEYGKIGLAICYDLRFPELFRKLTLMGAIMIVIPSAFIVSTGKDHWEILLKARAIENQVYIVAPNQFGKHNPKRVSYGHSMIIGPWGVPIAHAEDREGIIMADMDKNYLDEVRNKLPVLNHIQDFLCPQNES